MVKDGKEASFNDKHFHYKYPTFWKWFDTIPKSAKIVEIGCGTASNTKKLLQMGFSNIHLLDIEDQRTFSESAMVPRDPLRALPFTIIDSNIEPLPFGDGTVDCVIATEVIEHLENPWFFIREIYRVLAPTGVLMLSMPMPWNFLSRLLYLRKGMLEHYGLTHPHHPWAPTKEIFQQTLKGFDLKDAFYSQRKKMLIENLLGFSLKFNFPATKVWCEYACFLFKKNSDPGVIPRW